MQNLDVVVAFITAVAFVGLYIELRIRGWQEHIGALRRDMLSLEARTDEIERMIGLSS
jgi:hypothetical protein